MNNNASKFDNFSNKAGEAFNRIITRFIEGLEHKSDKLEKNSSFNFYGILFIAAVAFAIMYIMNYLTPLAADDYNYHYIYWNNCSAGTELTSLSDIFTSMVYHYGNVNGRVLLHSILQFFIILRKPIFNVANAMMYVALTLLIYKHCKGSGKSGHNVLLYLLINLMLWIFVNVWGQVFVWMDGSVNYLWGSVIRLTALLPFRLYADVNNKIKNSWYYAVLMLLWSSFAGATNENTGAALIGMMALFMIFYRVRKKVVPIWSFTGLAGALAGYAFMLLAPSNSIRHDDWSKLGNSFIKRLINIPGNSILNLAIPAMLYVICAYLLYKFGSKDKSCRISVSFIYILGVFGGIYAMLASPYFPTRAWFGVTVMMIIAIGNLLYQFWLTPVICRRVVAASAVFCSLYCAMSLVKTIEDASEVKSAYNQRAAYIENEKKKGNFDLELEPITPKSEHSPLYEVPDISAEGTDNWGNQSKAAYYGLDSVTSAD